MFISDMSIKKLTKQQVEFLKRYSDLDKYYSDKRLGAFVENGNTYFRLFTPNAVKVELVLFNHYADSSGKRYEMHRDLNAVWETTIDGELHGTYYAFSVFHKDPDKNTGVICLDPYARAVATYNSYLSPRKGIVIKDDHYDWEGDEWIQRDWRDLIIYEMHIRDMTAHPSSGAKHPGTYRGLTEKGIRGGIDYIKNLGINTVELLPAQEFANIEIPYRDSAAGRLNTWNPYERNHWGYMTAAFFAPEAYYSEDWHHYNKNVWMGTSGRQVNDFKDMVKAFHKEGIAVIMDVVYNHISEYEFGNLKEIDKEYYFRLDANGNFISESYCGNDFKTERPMARRMIVESVLYWMKEYHIDGFRFDLGKLIDWETVEEIIRRAQIINPDVIIVCEPWGGGYDPMGFSVRGWASWNDQIRNGIKGENPVNGHGWIFGKWYGNNDPDRVKSYVNGTLLRDKHGLFQKKEHSVNYLESHDGYTLGDFIRIGLGDVKADEVIKNLDKHVKLTPLQLKLNKLAALFLFTSQGITMIHSGQEFARSKVIHTEKGIVDNHKGMLDHNSYNKDNETNYINYEEADLNAELVNYYSGLIKLRKSYSSFRRAKFEEIKFFKIADNEFAIGYEIVHKEEHFIVLLNANLKNDVSFYLLAGNWDVVVNKDKAGINPLNLVHGKIRIESSTGMVLRKTN